MTMGPVNTGGGLIWFLVMIGLFIMIAVLTWFTTKSAETVVGAPSPSPAAATCTVSNATAVASGASVDTYNVHIVRCGVHRQIHIAGLGTLNDTGTLDFPAGTVPVADLPYIHQSQAYASYICQPVSHSLYGNDIQLDAWVFADGSISITNNIVFNDTDILGGTKLGAVFAELSGFDAGYANNASIALTCDLNWLSASAVATAAGAASLSSQYVSAASVAILKARIRGHTAKVPHASVPAPVPAPLPPRQPVSATRP